MFNHTKKHSFASFISLLFLIACHSSDSESVVNPNQDQTSQGILITSVYPSIVSKKGGTKILIQGTHFSPSVQISFGENPQIPATEIVWMNETSIQVTTPIFAGVEGTTQIIATNPDGTSFISKNLFQVYSSNLQFSAPEQSQNLGVGSRPNSNPVAIIHADLNQDSYEDLLLANEHDHSVNALFWNPTEQKFNYAQPILIHTDNHPVAIQAADFTFDGMIDIIIATRKNTIGNLTGNELILLEGAGNGQFSKQFLIVSQIEPQTNAMVIGDFTNDGIVDIALAVRNFPSPNNQSGIIMIPGQQSKTSFFGNPFPIFSSSSNIPLALLSADLNQDGKRDFVFHDQNTVFILKNRGENQFIPQTIFEVSLLRENVGMVLRDYSTEAHPQLLVSAPFSATDLNQSGLYLFSQLETSPIQSKKYAANELQLTNPTHITKGDFDSDGLMDLAILEQISGKSYVSILLGKQGGSFRAIPQLFEVEPKSVLMVPCDFNKDGKLDLAIVTQFSGRVQIFLNQTTENKQ